MRVELLAGTAGVLLADLTEVVLGQMHQHVLFILESSLALGTRMSNDVVPVISLKMPGQVFPERFEILQSSAALTTEQSSSCVTALGRVFVSQIGWLGRGLLPALLTSVLRVVSAVQFQARVFSTVQRIHPSVLAVLENVVLCIGRCGGTGNTTEGTHHQSRTKPVGSMNGYQMVPQRAQRGELHGALITGKRVLVMILPLWILLILPLVIVGSLGSVQRFLSLISDLLVAPVRRRRYRHALPAQDRLVHRVHVHLKLLHAAERVPGAVHAGELQRRGQDRRAGTAALRALQSGLGIQGEVQGGRR